MSTADVVIVGGGIEGAAAAWALSQRGVTEVVVAERNTVASGMTGKSSGIVRCHYGVTSLAAMAAVGLEVFEKAEGHPARSYPAQMPLLTLDRIYVRDLSVDGVERHVGGPWARLSDHVALAARLSR